MWLCVKMRIPKNPVAENHFAVWSCSSGSTIPCTTCVQRMRRRRRCSSDGELLHQGSLTSLDWFNLKTILQQNQRIYQVFGVSCTCFGFAILGSIRFNQQHTGFNVMCGIGVYTRPNAYFGEYDDKPLG